MGRRWQGVLKEYKKSLPITQNTPHITLGEGDTPLVRAHRIEERLRELCGFLGRIYLKLERDNPTGSFKDRGMVVAVAKALESGAKAIICASTGNTASSAAAYGAEAGIPVIVVVPAGNVAKGKIAQMIAYGARVVYVNAKFDACQEIVEKIARRSPEVVVVNSTNPYRIQGQKTAAFEICDDLGGAPDYHFIPVGNAGNITAYWLGYQEWCEKKNRSVPGGLALLNDFSWHFFWSDHNPPHMMGWQAEGAAPIVRGRIVEDPETVASAIKVGNPASWKSAVCAMEESRGKIDAVSDAHILEAHALIARLHPQAACEPASAASVAGLFKAVQEGSMAKDKSVVAVCTLTGHFLKDPEATVRDLEEPTVLEANSEAVFEFLEL